MTGIPDAAVRAAIHEHHHLLIDRPEPTVLSDMELFRRVLAAALPHLPGAPVTDEMVERACGSLWWDADAPASEPYTARAADFVRLPEEYSAEEMRPGGQRDRDLAALQTADREAGQQNRAAMRRALEAALHGERATEAGEAT